MKKLALSFVCCCVLAGQVAGAEPTEVYLVEFPERETVTLVLAPSPGAPDAKLEAKVTFRGGQARVEMTYASMKPAILFGGDVTSYVAWAVGRDGSAQNLGEIRAGTPKGAEEFTTGKKRFALIVTAEPYYLVNQPSEMVVFRNEMPKQKKFNSIEYNFKNFGPVPDHALDSIREVAWDSKVALDLLQARKAFELAGQADAARYAKSIYVEAKESLDNANELEKKGPTNKKLQEYARQSVELSNEAINISRQRMAMMEIEAMIAKRQAEMEGLEAEAAAAELQVADLARQKQDLEAAVVALNARTKKAETESADLSAMLGYALSKVAEAQDTAEGYVVSLPDILFDFNRADLKPEAERPLAKLAGILLILQGFGVTIEGYTDSTGTEEYNLKLSEERAKSVLDFIVNEGVRPDRLASVGFGPAKAIADNETEEGRAKNRRVEIVLTRLDQ